MSRPEASRAAAYSPLSPINQPHSYRSATTGASLYRRGASPERSFSPLKETVNSARIIQLKLQVRILLFMLRRGRDVCLAEQLTRVVCLP